MGLSLWRGSPIYIFFYTFIEGIYLGKLRGPCPQTCQGCCPWNLLNGEMKKCGNET